eukprot:12401968-Karenia_brevis.AAC.1
MSKRWTHMNDGLGQHKQMCDYALVNFKSFGLVNDSGTVPQVDMGSDHRAIRLSLKINSKARIKPTKHRRRNVERGWKPNSSEEYKSTADNELVKLGIKSSLEADG